MRVVKKGSVPFPSWALFACAAILPVAYRSDTGGAMGIALFVAVVGILLGLAPVFWMHKKKLRPVT